MHQAIVHQKEKLFIGLELRTNNEECSLAMPAHKDKFFKENIPSKIPNKISEDILALYTDYEGDYTKPYSWILGCEVSSLKQIPKGLVGKVIPKSKYTVFTTKGEFPQGLIAAWQAIWKSNLHRSYTSDFEVYASDFDPKHNPGVKVYIAIEDALFKFKPVEIKDQALVHKWLIQPHCAEWIHGVGLQNTLKGLQEFFKGESNTTYWIAYDHETPFAFLITSPEGNDATTLDLFICDLNYLGKGMAVPMIHEFLINHFPNVKRVLIDPEATNTKAIHVYQKAGFKIIGEFIASWHPVPHYQMELHMQDLLKLQKK